MVKKKTLWWKYGLKCTLELIFSGNIFPQRLKQDIDLDLWLIGFSDLWLTYAVLPYGVLCPVRGAWNQFILCHGTSHGLNIGNKFNESSCRRKHYGNNYVAHNRMSRKNSQMWQ